jgi:type VI secretion system VasD/TssJ family lipoprotein
MGLKCFGYEGFLGAAVPAVALFALLPGLACSHDPPPPPQAPAPCPTPEPMRVSLQASQRLNPGERGEALATVVRLYQLKGTAKIANASFDDLLDHDRDALGEDFLSVQEVTINPGDRLDPAIQRNPDTTTLGAVALFRQPAGTTWRAIVKLSPPDPQYCHPPKDNKDSKNSKTDTTKNDAKLLDNVTRIFLDENRLELR